MPINKRTQKQIAERFKDNLNYYNKPHYWRRLRFWTTALVTLAGVAALAAYYWMPKRPEAFFNPGPLTRAHASLENNCSACHTKAQLAPRDVLAASSIGLIDAECEKCHEARGGFEATHQPDQVGNTSCSACHHEHVGPGPMPPASDAECAACHDNSENMKAAAAKGRGLPESAFPTYTKPGLVYFPKQRPPQGYTTVFRSFWKGHPEFYFNKDGIKDANPLRYNHSIHIRSSRIPPVNGRKLDCNYCHVPDRSGEGFERVTFEANCRACHGLKFDSDFPDLNIPHADPSNVRSFLRGVETGTRYRDYAIIVKGMTAEQADQFARDNIAKLRERLRQQGVSSMNDYERLAFFGDGRNRPEMPSCNYCHVVMPSQGGATPQVARVQAADRFFRNGKFNHAKHTQLNCTSCHEAEESPLTSDVLMPSQASCAACHSPPGFSAKSGVVHDCAFCHEYHAPAAPKKAAGADTQSVKEFLLAR